MSWLMHWLGLDNPSGAPYLFWSGIGANLSASAIVLGVLRALHVHTCHAKGCYRIGRHIIPGTTYVACRKHQAQTK